MEKLTIKAILTIIILAISGCSSNSDKPKVPNLSAQILFSDAREKLDKGLYVQAIEILTAIDSRFPFGPVSHQVQLDLVFAYYKSGDVAQGLALAERFLKLNPNHPNVDYVYYIRALINLSQDKNLFQEFAGIDRRDRDPKPSLNAFNDFKTIITNYPDSIYASDARQRMVGIKSRLAAYELKVAKYYIKREAWASAANRARYVVEYFSPSTEMEQALEIMIESYSQLELPELLSNAKQVLAVNFPDNPIVQ